MGSSGVEAHVGARLQAVGEDVALIARGAHLQALQIEGLRLEHPLHPMHLPQVQVSADSTELVVSGTADLVVFAVKLGDTVTTARALGPRLGPQTRILPLQNGFDNVRLIQAQVGRRQCAVALPTSLP
jgi:2-dehydropantoate 2-reductase